MKYTPLPKVDETLAQLVGATVFSKLDANSGFWQIPLATESHLLTTFTTPFGRFCFNKLPFGISSAPCRALPEADEWNSAGTGWSGMPDQWCADIWEEHDSRLIAALQRIERAGVTLSAEKCQFSKIKFLGHIIDERAGIQPDPENISAIVELDPPWNETELRRFMV